MMSISFLPVRRNTGTTPTPILHRDAPVHRLAGEGLTPQTDAFILSRYDDINRVVKDPLRFTPITSLMLEQLAASETPPEQMDYINMMMVSMLTLRPTVELWRAHRKELTDPWVGPGAERHREMITQRVDALIDQLPSEGEIDFVQAFARPLPQQVMAQCWAFPKRIFRSWRLGVKPRSCPLFMGKAT